MNALQVQGTGTANSYRVEEFSFQKAVRNCVPKLFQGGERPTIMSDTLVAMVQINCRLFMKR